jgi:hypothetical protein
MYFDRMVRGLTSDVSEPQRRALSRRMANTLAAVVGLINGQVKEHYGQKRHHDLFPICLVAATP